MTERLFVNGQWVSSTSEAAIDVVDPITEEVTARVPAGSEEDVDAAVAAAVAAQPAWAATPVAERLDLLSRLAVEFERRYGEIARTVQLDLGCSVELAGTVHVDLAIDTVRGYAAALVDACADRSIVDAVVVREPVGVVAAITPWNYPIYQTASKVAAAIGTGNAVILKPSELAPRSAYLLVRILDELGLPPGVLNLVTGTGPTIGEALVSHPDVRMVSFTGSTRAGRRVAELAAADVKRVTLELGGKSAAVLLPGGDLDAAVSTAVASAFTNSGQSCSALTRLLVPAGDHEAAAEAAGRAAKMAGVGLGPLVSRAQFERVQDFLTEGVAGGARVVTGGPGRPEGVSRGYYARPTVFAGVNADMRIAREEIFGPVLCILPYGDEAEALELANATIYGLSGAVWGADRAGAERFARRMQTGRVDVNGGSFNAGAPFGGYKQSGNGRELGRYGLEEFLEVKALQFGDVTGPASAGPERARS